MAQFTIIEEIDFEDTVYDIPVELIDHDDDWNSRGKISAIECISLAKDIKLNGQQLPGQLRIYDTPIDGKPFGLISGFRRYYAVQTINCESTYRAVFKKDVSDFEAKALNYAENRERQNLNMLQEAWVRLWVR